MLAEWTQTSSSVVLHFLNTQVLAASERSRLCSVLLLFVYFIYMYTIYLFIYLQKNLLDEEGLVVMETTPCIMVDIKSSSSFLIVKDICRVFSTS